MLECRVTRRIVGAGIVLAALGLALALGWQALAGAAGSYLLVETPLAPATAIVVLGGGLPYRELEGAALYQAGWAPRVLLIPAVTTAQRDQALREAGVVLPTEQDMRREILTQRGVPASAIELATTPVADTRDELCIAARLLAPTAGPVILVTSPYHARRVGLTWESVTHGQPPALVRVAHQEPYDGAQWWQQPQQRRMVPLEFLGLLNLWTGFMVPMAPGARAC